MHGAAIGPWAVPPVWPRHQILHALRGMQEEVHRQLCCFFDVEFVLELLGRGAAPGQKPRLPPPAVREGHAQDFFQRVLYLPPPGETSIREKYGLLPLAVVEQFCNKTIPLAFMDYETSPAAPLLLMKLHNYIYRQWFDPIKSEIEWGRYLVSVYPLTNESQVPDLEPDPAHIVDTAMGLSEKLCRAIKRSKRAIRNFIGPSRDEVLETSFLARTGWPADKIAEHHRMFVLQPTFQCLMMVVCASSYDPSRPVEDLPVYLVRTADAENADLRRESKLDFLVDMNLATSVTAGGVGRDAVKLPLSTAVTFAKRLEKRYGEYVVRQSPSNLESAMLMAPDLLRLEAYRRGWVDSIHGRLEGPSVRWADGGNFPVWSGKGQEYDSNNMTSLEVAFQTRYEAAISGEETAG